MHGADKFTQGAVLVGYIYCTQKVSKSTFMLKFTHSGPTRCKGPGKNHGYIYFWDIKVGNSYEAESLRLEEAAGDKVGHIFFSRFA